MATLVVITRIGLDRLPAQARSWGSTLVAADGQTVGDIPVTYRYSKTIVEDDNDVPDVDHDRV